MATAVAHQTDEDIQREVLLELKWDAKIAPIEIGVSVKNGVVTLIGQVDTFSKRWVAERAALRVRGVKGVANEIEVRLRARDQPTDPEIAESAARALALDCQIINAFFRDPLDSGTGQQPVWIPAADLKETGDAYIIELELPGVRRTTSPSSSATARCGSAAR